MSNIRYPMIISCVIPNLAKMETIFERILRGVGYIEITKNNFIHGGGAQLTATIIYSKIFLPETNKIKDCITLYLSDAEHVINNELCNELNRILSYGLMNEKAK